jgi:hypothetical protein
LLFALRDSEAEKVFEIFSQIPKEKRGKVIYKYIPKDNLRSSSKSSKKKEEDGHILIYGLYFIGSLSTFLSSVVIKKCK